ncbi:MAG: Ig-like domain-containing protein [Prevotellaceae bacterium]|jgi:uncharacterized protein YjdB|nr:Ig-like domain-containing protein [Prevotellaceae bacterium]
MKKISKLMASMLAIATFVMVIASCDENENTEPSKVEVSSITVAPNSIYLEIDSTGILTATLLPEDVSIDPTDSIIWSTYNKEVATVRPTGALTAEVKGVSIGTTTVTIVTSNNKRAICEVTVSKSVPLVAISVKPAGPLHLEPGSRLQLVATQGPANTTNYHPVWTSSKPEVVTVDDGLIFAESAGTSIITITSGNISQSVEVLVTDPLSSITIEPNELLHLKEIGNTQQLTATPVPEITKDYNPVWTSSDENVVTVSETGFVTAIDIGTAKIIVASGNISDTVDVKVTSAYLSDFVLTPNTDTFISTGENLQINVTPIPESAENYQLTWTSSDESIASVSETGLVTGHAPGLVAVTVSSNSTMDGSTISRSVTVFVNLIETKYSTAGWTAESKGGNHNWGTYGGQAFNVLDGDIYTAFHSNLSSPLPQCIVIDMKEPKTVTRLVLWHTGEAVTERWQIYLQDIEVYLSNNPVVDFQPSEGDKAGSHYYVDSESYESFTINLVPNSLNLVPNSQGQYLILYFPTSTNGSGYISLADVDVYGVQ